MKQQNPDSPCTLDLITRISNCTACNLCNIYPEGLPTIGIGNISPKVMFIGEAPGKEEMQVGKPFVGRAGKILQTILQRNSILFDQIYVTNVVKHRPLDNSLPTSDQIAACMPFLLEEIEFISPKAIVCLGKTASLAIAASASISLPASKIRGTCFFYKKIPVLCTWHPAYIARTPYKMPELETDILSMYGLESA